MDLILNNPYRHLGLIAGASAKEQKKQETKLKLYLEAEQEPDSDFSFPTLGKLHRTVKTVSVSSAKIVLDGDKMLSALFWFYDGKTALNTDNDAFNAIKVGDLDQVMEIWGKLTTSLNVTRTNASAFNNLSTLYLSGVQDGTLKPGDILKMGLFLKLLFLDSEHWIDLKNNVIGQNYQTTKEELQIEFLRAVEREVRNKDFIDTSFIQIVNSLEFTSKERYLNEYIVQPIAEIQVKIDATKAKRKADISKADKFGDSLYNDSFQKINELKSTLNTENLKVKSICDKLAEEILQCSIDFYNYCNDKSVDVDYLEIALKLAAKSDAVAIGSLTKERIKENLTTLYEIKAKNLCYFCGTKIASKESSYKKTIYKETYRNPWYAQRREVKFQKAEVITPRCKDCYQIHNSSSIWLSLLPFSLAGIGLILGLTVWGYWFLHFIGGGFLGIFIGAVLNSLSKDQKSLNANIKMESDFTNYGPIKDLLNSGWQTTEPIA